MKLPSDAAAQKLLAGKPGAVVDVAFWTSVRAALIAGGLWVVGDRHKLWLKGYAGALAVEVFMLLWAATHREEA
jgi:hypothetical protein